MDTTIQSLYDGWKKYLVSKNINDPQDTDLIKFLSIRGFNPSDISAAMKAGLGKSEQPPTPTKSDRSSLELDDDKVDILNRIKLLIKNDMQPNTILALKKRLENE